MEILMMALLTTLAFAIGGAMRDSAWRDNATRPMRMMNKGAFYKVVKLDSNHSWEMLDIHEDERGW